MFNPSDGGTNQNLTNVQSQDAEIDRIRSAFSLDA
jgi:hypothetical protein